MNRKYTNLFRIFFAFSDLFILNLLNLILLKLSKAPLADNFDYAFFCVFNNMVWFICSYSTSIYINTKFLNFSLLFKKTLISFMMLLAIDILFVHFTVFDNHSFVIRSLFSFFLFLSISRVIFTILIKNIYKQEAYKKRIVFIGFNKHSRELVNHFRKTFRTVTVEGFFDDAIIQNNYEVPILGRIEDCLSYSQKNNVTEIYSTLSPKNEPSLYGLAQEAEASFIRFKFIPDLSEYVDQDCHIDFIEGTPIISIRREPLENLPSQFKKRVFDVLLSSFVVIFILSWLLPILAILVKWDSNGPVFFRQDRSGKNNRPFKCLKIRTLKINENADLVQVTRNDDRITRVGRFLRKSNLDELPQFFNVLVGDMSVVGSRPHMLKHTEDYSKVIDNYMVRHFIKPGVTGWAQVNGLRGEIKQEEHLRQRVEHDIWYMENWNIWLDIRIVLLTFSSTIKGDKNAF